MSASKRRLALAGLIAPLLLVALVALVLLGRAGAPFTLDPASGPAAVLFDGPPAPELTGGGAWINSAPLSLAGLRGKVVLVDFWTYGCINCRNTLPALRGWWDTYRSQGLVIVGVHAPEFAHEHELANVQEAVRREQIGWPVVQDNDFAIWSAYRNRYWPHLYLIDRQGRLVYDHIGEGAYAETERRIQEALAAK